MKPLPIRDPRPCGCEVAAQARAAERPRPGLVRPVRMDPAGVAGPTRHQARRSRWRRTSHGYYVPSGVSEADVEQRILEASVVAPGCGALTGWAALRWRGARWLTGAGPDGSPRPIDVVVNTHDIRPQPGITVTGESCPPSQWSLVDGVPVAAPTWAASYAARYARSLAAAVGVLDMAMFADLISLVEIAALARQQSGWTGVPRLRDAIGLATENAWSPAEVDLRLVWGVLGRLPSPRCNAPIFDLDGRHLATPDLIDPTSGLVVEYDGRHHLEHEQRRHDRGREERLRFHGLVHLVALAGDLADRGRLVGRLRTAREVALRVPDSDRRWTLEQPDWWIPTETVAQRRRLDAGQRARLLRHRSV